MAFNEKKIVDNVEYAETQENSESSKLELSQRFDNLSDAEIKTLEKRRKYSSMILPTLLSDYRSGPKGRPSSHRLAVRPLYIQHSRSLQPGPCKT